MASIFVHYCSEKYRTINDITVIYLSHSLLHVSTGNYGNHLIELQLYEREHRGRERLLA
jgi:hypothetical protein